MLELFHFIFSSLWVFFGTLLLIGILGAAIIGIIRALKD